MANSVVNDVMQRLVNDVGDDIPNGVMDGAAGGLAMAFEIVGMACNIHAAAGMRCHCSIPK